jgi:hypothetical protein
MACLLIDASTVAADPSLGGIIFLQEIIHVSAVKNNGEGAVLKEGRGVHDSLHKSLIFGIHSYPNGPGGGARSAMAFPTIFSVN